MNNDQETFSFRLLSPWGCQGSAAFAAWWLKRISKDFDSLSKGRSGPSIPTSCNAVLQKSVIYEGSALHCHGNEVPVGVSVTLADDWVALNFPKIQVRAYAAHFDILSRAGRYPAPARRLRPFPWVLRWKPRPDLKL